MKPAPSLLKPWRSPAVLASIEAAIRRLGADQRTTRRSLHEKQCLLVSVKNAYSGPPPSHRHHEAGALSVAATALTCCIDFDRGRDLDSWSGSKDNKKVTSRKAVPVAFCLKRSCPPPPHPIASMIPAPSRPLELPRS
jgi:hypothetical protein